MRPGGVSWRALVGACHPAPALAVTVLAGLLAAGAGKGVVGAALVTGAVGAGQLSIGWSNDLIDAERDRAVGRRDKPLVRGDLPDRVVRRATGLALVACVVLSLACGWRSAVVHLVLGVGSGWAYNLVLKATVWSFVPYAAAFGSLPGVVTLARPGPHAPALALVVAGALLGVGAHLFNVLPDLEDDERTGVRGLPHRLGAARVRVLAPVVLLAASVVALGGAWSSLTVAALVLVVLLAALAVVGRGRLPFLATLAIAAVDVVALVVRS